MLICAFSAGGNESFDMSENVQATVSNESYDDHPQLSEDEEEFEDHPDDEPEISEDLSEDNGSIAESMTHRKKLPVAEKEEIVLDIKRIGTKRR